MPSISVVIPGYNNGAFIADTLATVLNQTHQPDEIIVIDDGSTDDTERVVKSFSDARIRYHRQENQGVSVARNHGISLARSELIAFLDSDDRWRPHTLERQLQLMIECPQAICCFGNFVRFENTSGQYLPDQFTFYPELSRVPARHLSLPNSFLVERDAFKWFIAFGEFPAYTQSMMFRAALIRDVRFDPELVRCQDADFVLRVMLRGPVAFTSEVLAEVRRHPGNATRDVGMMALDKLRAIQRMGRDPLVDPFRHEYNRRLTRAKLDAAGALALRKRWKEAARYWSSSFRSGGGFSQLAKGTARLLWTALSSSMRP